jgi:hypothetical protein
MLAKRVVPAVLGFAVLSGCMDQPAHPSAEPENTSALRNGLVLGSGNRSEPDTSTVISASEGEIVSGEPDDAVSRGGYLGGSGN